MVRERVLFEFEDLRISPLIPGKRYAIVASEGYGITAPLLWTTNGSFSYVARALYMGIEAQVYVLPPEWVAQATSVESLKEALIDAYRAAYPDRKYLP